MLAQLSTQGSHGATTKSQISPTTQTPSSCVSEEEGERFAFGLRAAGPCYAAAAAGGAAAAAASPGGSQTSDIGPTGGILRRDRADHDNGGDGGGGGDRLTVLSLELHVQVGANRRPDPRRDSVHAICWRVKDAFTSTERETAETRSGVIVLPLPTATTARGGTAASGARPPGDGGGEEAGASVSGSSKHAVCLKCGEQRDDAAKTFCSFEGGGFLGQVEVIGSGDRERADAGAGAGAGFGRGTFCHGLGKDVEVLEVCSEEQVFRALIGVFCRHDPDFVVGWEVQGDSLGYVVERGLNMVMGLGWSSCGVVTRRFRDLYRHLFTKGEDVICFGSRRRKAEGPHLLFVSGLGIGTECFSRI